VCLGTGDDEHLAQQSIRTFFNVSRPSRHYVKTSLSVLNMGFLRGLPAAYMRGTPAINDWLTALIADDERLSAWRFGILRERASIGYHQEHYEAATAPGSPYLKMLAASGARARCRPWDVASGWRRWRRCSMSTTAGGPSSGR
jgi:siderophore synthetase component